MLPPTPPPSDSSQLDNLNFTELTLRVADEHVDPRHKLSGDLGLADLEDG